MTGLRRLTFGSEGCRAMNAVLFVSITAALMFGSTSIGVAQQGKVPVEAWQWLQTTDVVRVIVRLHTAVATTPEGARDQPAQQRAVLEAERTLLASLRGTKYRMSAGSLTVPFLNLEVGKDALAVLDRSPVVKSVTPIPLRPLGQVPVDVWEAAWRETVVSIMVELHTDVGTTPGGALDHPAQRRAIARAQDKLLVSLVGTEYKLTKRLTIMPIIGLYLQPDALVVVDRSPVVKRVVAERLWANKIPEDVWQKAWTNGVVRVFVQFDGEPEAQDRLLASLAGTKHEVAGRYGSSLWLKVGVDALAVLDRSPLVKRVREDIPARPATP